MPDDPTPRVRRDVRSLLAEGAAGRAVLDDYARAITAMRALDVPGAAPTDPRSWGFQAAIHGRPGVRWKATDPKRWASCRHNSWFFLPWHRIYLLCFEQIVQSHLDDPTWSLPYWDWSVVGDDGAQTIPEPFRVPADAGANPLYTAERNDLLNAATNPRHIPFDDIDARPSLALGDFSLPSGEDPAASFGGGVVQDVVPVMQARGSVEGAPHGNVHGYVGGQSGWMSAFETAGLDPVFWLHHANVDRLWDVWTGLWGEGAVPTDPAWEDTTFSFFGPDGQPFSLRIAEVLDSEALGYRYESVEPPAGTLPDAPPGIRPAIAEVGPVPNPELMGAESDVSFAQRATVDIGLEPLAVPGVAGPGPAATPERWFVRVEDIAGEQPAVPAYSVFVNLPAGASPADHPELRAGTISAFGIREATAADNGAPGLTDVFDITAVVDHLRTTGWDGGALAVTIVPMGLDGEAADGGDVHAGRVSVYAG